LWIKRPGFGYRRRGKGNRQQVKTIEDVDQPAQRHHAPLQGSHWFCIKLRLQRLRIVSHGA
jgi:hypothetical protein